ncbi:hypothetical protein [Promicromonospora soli]
MSYDHPEETVDVRRIERLAGDFGVTGLRAIKPEASIDFHLPFEEGGDSYVEVDLDAGLIDWYARKYEAETGRSFSPAPNVSVSWTLTGEVNEELDLRGRCGHRPRNGRHRVGRRLGLRCRMGFVILLPLPGEHRQGLAEVLFYR